MAHCCAIKVGSRKLCVSTLKLLNGLIDGRKENKYSTVYTLCSKILEINSVSG